MQRTKERAEARPITFFCFFFLPLCPDWGVPLPYSLSIDLSLMVAKLVWSCGEGAREVMKPYAQVVGWLLCLWPRLRFKELHALKMVSDPHHLSCPPTLHVFLAGTFLFIETKLSGERVLFLNAVCRFNAICNSHSCQDSPLDGSAMRNYSPELPD